VPVSVRPPSFLAGGRQGVANVAPLLGAREEDRRLGVGETVVMTAYEVVSEPMPGVDRDLDHGVEALVEQEPAREAVLERHLLRPVRNEEQDPVWRAIATQAELDEPLLEDRGLARPRPPERDERPFGMVDDRPLLRIERQVLGLFRGDPLVVAAGIEVTGGL